MMAWLRQRMGLDARSAAPDGGNIEGVAYHPEVPGQVITDWLEQYVQERQYYTAKARPDELAAVDASAGLVGRAFSLADVEPRLSGLTAGLLGLIGRELVYRGESVLVIDADIVEGLTLTPSSSFDVTGGWRESTWRYRCDLQGPSRTTTQRRESTEVIHPRINVEAKRPWRGQAPWKTARLTANLAARIEIALTRESMFAPSRLIPFPDTTGEQRAPIEQSLTSGGLVVVGAPPSLSEGSVRLEPQVIGAQPDRALVELREQVTAEVFAACGCPQELFRGSEGAASREALRRWLHTTLLPWAEVVSAELSKKLDRDVHLSFDRLMASDLSGRARAFQSMVHGGMALSKAARLAGLMEDDGA